MRHRKRIAKLARPADQRKALLRSLLTQLFVHGQIVTTLHRARALRPLADKVVGLAKRGHQGELHAIRQITRLIYNFKLPESEMRPHGKAVQLSVLRRILWHVAPQTLQRKSGYVRVLPAPPRRGDAAPMAVIELVDFYPAFPERPKASHTAHVNDASPEGKSSTSAGPDAAIAAGAASATTQTEAA
jgi:large subunit ribosomal protein L17